jgi:hypothetical protein
VTGGEFVSSGQVKVTSATSPTSSPTVNVISNTGFNQTGSGPLIQDSINADADLTYYFEIVGPASPTSVQIDLSGNFAYAQGDTTPEVSALSIAGNSYNYQNTGTQPFPDISVPTNTVESVVIQSSAHTQYSEGGDFSIGGVDSFAFQIDPSTSNLTAYSIDTSSNLVPEPTCAALIGLSSLGLLRRKRSRQ